MSEIANTEGTSSEPEKPVLDTDVKFPPFPEPKHEDFEEDISEEERIFYKLKFTDLNLVKHQRLHCTACDRHLGCSARNESRMRAHPMLRTLMCHTCHTFYNSGEFEKGDDGSELYCRWCGQGGQVYCCSNCPHVFCAKCIKRNLGLPKIKEIESTEDWKCFKCNSKCLWDLRALCWALLRYCDLKNKFAYNAEDPELKEGYQKDCAIDHAECCKHKIRQRKSDNLRKREEKKIQEVTIKKNISPPITKIGPTIQVKKFASINIDEIKQEKKPVKRPASPKLQPMLIKNPIPIAPGCTKMITPISTPPIPKKIKVCNANMMPPVRFNNERKPFVTYPRMRTRAPQTSMTSLMNSQFNGFNNGNNFSTMVINDNINLSLESLTQGLDMNAVAAMTNNNTPPNDDDVVCTPDFPLEPLCEVTEDNTDDDVQCITPAPVPVPPKHVNPPPLIPCATNITDLSSENIIQMTENDVTVNAATGGLKFRVDPQTLSSNKMYRLPDGRIFAINANPNMPGGYSATIVAVTENAPGSKTLPKMQTYSAKLSAVSASTSSPQTSTPIPKSTRLGNSRSTQISKRNISRIAKMKKSGQISRECDMQVPVEWYRYNLLDSVDALEYSLSKLHKIKKEATSMYLRTRTVSEMRTLHRSLERLLNTSSNRFIEIRDNLNKEFKVYLTKKAAGEVSEDDDDVEILPNLDENDDPIFIDENSVDSNANCNDGQEVDLTGAGSSEHNDSAENRTDNFTNVYRDSLALTGKESPNTNTTITNISSIDDANSQSNQVGNNIENEKDDQVLTDNKNKNNHPKKNSVILDKLKCDELFLDKDVSIQSSLKEVTSGSDKHVSNESELLNENSKSTVEEVVNVEESKDKRGEIQVKKTIKNNENFKNKGDNIQKVQGTEVCDGKIQDNEISDEKFQDTDMSDEMIESLLKDDNGKDSLDCT
ncbi:uncharacterized protein DDB_G0288805 [Achroia grisella]|uniref:uncharacterized protein DDB_G0288805 n=1 Tax=Achroia grisella TaxID=688607 RepID=UPI0027D30F02|nr:uncharacterized protein DDB_G0288805 [Achroia grisella]